MICSVVHFTRNRIGKRIQNLPFFGLKHFISHRTTAPGFRITTVWFPFKTDDLGFC